MRVKIRFDSASTDQVRAMSVALHRATGNNNLTLGVEGPEGWHGETPHLTPTQFAQVTAHVCKVDGVPISEMLDSVR